MGHRFHFKQGPGKRCGCGGRRPGEVELFGLVLLIIGVVTFCSFLLPSRLWIIMLGGLMIYCGYRLFTS